MTSKSLQRKRRPKGRRVIVVPTAPGRTRKRYVPPSSGRFRPKLGSYGPLTKRPKATKPFKGTVSVKVKFPRGHLPDAEPHGMRDHTEDILGVRLSKDPGGTLTYSFVPAITDTLSDVESHVGDHKHPNAQRFHHTVFTRHHGDVVSSFFGTDGFVKGWNGIAFVPYPVPNQETEVYNEALARMYSQIKGYVDLRRSDVTANRGRFQYGSTNVAVDIAEYHQVQRMLGDTLKSVFKFVEFLRELRHARLPSSVTRRDLMRVSQQALRETRRLPRVAGNAWLQFQYGWRPLADSIYGTLERMVTPKRLFYDVRVTSQKSSDGSQTLSYAGYPGVNELRAGIGSYRCLIRARYALGDTAVESLAGYTSLNPLAIAWELVPYSFVVDWFVNVGGYLAQVENALLYGNSFVDGFVTLSSRVDSHHTIKGSYSPFDGVVYTFDSTASQMDTTKKRIVLTDVPWPRFPGFAPELGSSRLLSAASLLAQHVDAFEKRLPEPVKRLPKFPHLWHL